MPDRLDIARLHGGLVTYPPGATYGPRVLGDFEMVWIIQGNAVWHVDGHDLRCGAGTTLLARPGMHDRFTWDRERSTRHAFFHFTLGGLPAEWGDPANWPTHRVMPEDDIVRPLFRHVLTGLRHGEQVTRVPAWQQRSVAALLEAFLSGHVHQRFEYDREEPEPVQRAMHFVRETLDRDPATPLALDDLARSASVSGEHLCRLFRQALGVGPMEAVRLSRLERAMTLLARSNLNVEQVARRCGFASPYHFSRRFKEVFGDPPTVVRRRVAEGQSPPLSPMVRRGGR